MAWPPELKMLKKVRSKYRAEYWLAGLLLAGAVAMLAYAGMTFLAALIPAVLSWRLAVAILAAAVVVTVIWRTQPGDREIAYQLDKDLASQERVQTLVENHQGQGPMLQQLRRETEEYFSRHKPKYRWDSKRFISPALLTGGAVVILIISIVLSPRLAKSLAQHREILEQQQEAAQQIQEIVELLPENPLGEELAAELEDMKELADSLTDPSEFETLLREALELLEAESEQVGAIESALEELQAAMNMTAEELAEAVGNPEFAGEISEALDNLAQALPKGMDLADALKELAENPSAAEADQWQQVKEQLADLDTATYRENLKEAIQAAQKLSGSEGQGSGEGEGQGSGEGEGQGSGEGEGQGSGEGEGQGQGEGQGSGEGDGAGTGSTDPSPSSYVYIPGQGEVILSGEGEAGEYTLRELLPNNPGLVDDYADFFSGYRRQALSRLSHSPIPRPLADYVRSYFEAIAPQGGK